MKDFSKLIVYLGILCIISILLIIIFNSIKDQPENYEKNLTNTENVISPVTKSENKYEINDYSVYFTKISNEPLIQFEKVLYNWQNLLDIFASNKANIMLKYAISKTNLQKLSSTVQIKQKEFFKGTSDEILSEYGKTIKEEASYYKLDWRLILSIIKQESDFTSTARSKAGAYGFMQIMPKTGSSLEQTLNLEDHTSPINNLIAGIYYYALLVGRYDDAGDPNKFMLALAAYNCGSGHVEDAMSIAYYEGKDFLKWENVSDVLKKLGPNYDTLHTIIWKSKPPNGTFTNWIEPLNYVFNIMYYWDQYKKIYPIPEDKHKINKKSKNK
jgi:soluble lytic murein transglycosylase-like protein